MLKDRLTNYKELEKKRKSKLIVYVTSDRVGMETQMSPDILSPLTNHLDLIGDGDKISLLLYTRGGHIMTAWSIVNLIRSFCKDFEVILPFHCHSAGTLLCLGANKLVMTKQASIGPIDPSTNGFMNPEINISNIPTRISVSVEHVNGYLEMAKKEIGEANEGMKDIFIQLSEKLHPLTLGEVYKTRTQIQMLAKKMLMFQKIADGKEEEIIKFLCIDSGSHDYTINRKEASELLGLNIEIPTMEEYKIIKAIYDDIEKELELTNPYDPKTILAQINSYTYSFRRVLIESITGGCDVFLSEGSLTKSVFQPHASMAPQTAINDARTFEGWKHENI